LDWIWEIGATVFVRWTGRVGCLEEGTLGNKRESLGELSRRYRRGLVV